MKKWLVTFLFVAFTLACYRTTLAMELNSDQNMIESQEADKYSDLTVPKVKADRMTKLVMNRQESAFSELQFLKRSMAKAVENGVSVNTIVLLLLFPLVAFLVAFSRQVVGISGFGMITPLLLSMAFLSTGGLVGIWMLCFVVGSATFFKSVLKKVRMPYLPKLAVLLWMLSNAVIGLMIFGGGGVLDRFLEIGIFPIILFMSVAETFIEAQITRSLAVSFTMLLETVVLAFLGYKLMNSPFVQSIALLNPEIWLMVVLFANVLVARYKGLRVLEVWRFRKIITR